MRRIGNPHGTTLAFIALSIAWGASFLFIKVGLEGMSPTQVVLGRLTLGAATLIGIMLITRRSWPREPRIWAHMIVIALTFAVLPYTLFSWAEQHVPSSLASIYNSTTPIMTLLLMPVMLRGERLGRMQIVGVLTGLGGVVVLAGPWRLSGTETTPEIVLAQLACLGATALYGFSGLYLRRFLSGTGHDPVTLSTLQIGLAAVIAWLIAPFNAVGPLSLDWRIVLAIAALGVLGTGFAYIWYNRILRDWGPARASTVTYLSPVAGVVLGVLLLGESIHWNEPLGGLLVVAGILASQGRLSFARTPKAGADTPAVAPASLR